ncbi:uncharacterized protein [Battus philenor]|uniref:uncharacterized protein n=1 Tax=Battus philenor TaxID=42288 RepID=UPI0035D03DDE
MEEFSVNIQTEKTLSKQLKSLKGQCAEAYNVIDNANRNSVSNDTQSKDSNFIEALRTQISTSDTAINTDKNLLTSQFLAEMKEKTEQVKELIAFTKGSIYDMDAEIQRLKKLIDTAQVAISKPKEQKKEILPQHVQKAKAKFALLKKELHGLICSLYPNSSDMIVEVLGELMQQRLNETSYGYIQVTSENYPVIELLKDMNLVCVNPYNNMEVKIIN